MSSTLSASSTTSSIPMHPESHPNYRPPTDVNCITLEKGNNDDRQRHDLGLRVGEGEISPFIISNLLSSGECKQIIELVSSDKNNHSAAAHLQKVDWEYVKSYRDCSRAVVRCPELAATIYQRLIPFLSRQECETVRPFGFDGGGEWRPMKLNPVMRISRYDKGGHFAPHKDGAFVENDNVRSVYTVLVYLNHQDFEGGNTHVHLRSSKEDKKASIDEICKVVPMTGNALVMLHDTLHSGEPVTNGQKFICRFDIMFHRLGDGMSLEELQMIPAREEAEKLYASSIIKQREGDVAGSTRDYLRAQDLQAQLPSVTTTSDTICSKKSALENFNEDLLVRSLRFLNPIEILNLSVASKNCRFICSNSLLWRELFLLRWPVLMPAESGLKREEIEEGNDTSFALAIHEPYDHRIYGRLLQSSYKRYTEVYVAVLSSKPKICKNGGREDMDRMYTNPPAPCSGYMFSSIALAEFGMKERQEQCYRWHRLKAVVNKSAIQFSEFLPDSNSEVRKVITSIFNLKEVLADEALEMGEMGEFSKKLHSLEKKYEELTGKDYNSSIGTSSAADLVGCHGVALFGKKNPQWHPCVVKKDNMDGTIKVQWDEGKNFTNSLLVEYFRLDADPESGNQTTSSNVVMIGDHFIPSSIPLLGNTEFMFAAKSYDRKASIWTKIDSCVLEIPSESKYVVICSENPHIKTERNRYYFKPNRLTRGIIADISRVIIARQTERALRYRSVDTVAVRCDAKTKQWKTAYSRRHLAEKFFDVITLDIGSQSTKMTTSDPNIERFYYMIHALKYFWKVAKRYYPHYLLENIFSPLLEKNYEDLTDEEEKIILKRIVDKGVAQELIDVSKKDDDEDIELRRKILEAKNGCSSIVSLVAKTHGHLWSAKHGLQNHRVGHKCEAMQNARGVYSETFPSKPDIAAMGIVIAYLIETNYVRRPSRNDPYLNRITCAEHPINIVEPLLGFSDGERLELIQILSAWNVPFVGFVNGAVAALMCGKNPRQNGIVVMLGGLNSGVALVRDGIFVRGSSFQNYHEQIIVMGNEDSSTAIEVLNAIEELLHSIDTVDTAEEQFLLFTGGDATNSVITLVKNNMKSNRKIIIGVASPEEERHLDAVRGGHILACLSNNQKHFKCVMNQMWAMQVSGLNYA